ncbi:MAG: HDIG domain-containing protein [Clostridia bacterium]|nr:HDIG domain-containing protein [Clostridia bacterium]
MENIRMKGKAWLEGASTGVKLALYALLTYAVLLCICLITISPEQYDISVGGVAPKTITASRDVEDSITTKRRRQAAADAVSPVYYKDDTVSEAVLLDLDAVFSELRAVRELGEQIRAGWTQDNSSFSAEDYAQASRLLTSITLSEYQVRTLMNTAERDFESLYQSVSSAAKTTLVSMITEGQTTEAINNIQQIVAYNTRTDLWYNIAIPTLRACLRPNMLIDQEATEENRQKAYDAVEPTIYKQDQNIVVKGDRVSAEQIAVLEALGLLRGDSVDYSLYINAAIAIALVMAAAYVFTAMFAPELFHMGRSALVLLIAGVLTIAMSLLFGRYLDVRAMPVMLAAMLAVNLLGVKPAILLNIVTAILMTFLTVKGTGIATAQAMTVLMLTAVGGTASIFLLRKNPARVFVLVSGLIVGVIDLLVMVAVDAVELMSLTSVLTGLGYALIGAFASAVLCVGLQPILEAAFNLVTPAKLIELSNPNQPLLRRLMIETPGTYHHSMIVANLGEAAAEAIGADALLVRVGAYYHDIGKLVRPMYFKENQIGENPHDKTDPRVSTAILTEHTRDGVELARKHHLPESLVDMIRQHHGDTPVMYFYAKTVKLLGEENVDLRDFRYDGPKPQTAEAAILMLADTVEAAVRSIQEPTREKMSAMIRKLVRGKMEDGQLDECTLTFRDIGKICTAFETVLQGVFHERIEYPKVDLKKAQRKSEKRAAEQAAAAKSAPEEKK